MLSNPIIVRDFVPNYTDKIQLLQEEGLDEITYYNRFKRVRHGNVRIREPLSRVVRKTVNDPVVDERHALCRTRWMTPEQWNLVVETLHDVVTSNEAVVEMMTNGVDDKTATTLHKRMLNRDETFPKFHLPDISDYLWVDVVDPANDDYHVNYVLEMYRIEKSNEEWEIVTNTNSSSEECDELLPGTELNERLATISPPTEPKMCLERFITNLMMKFTTRIRDCSTIPSTGKYTDFNFTKIGLDTVLNETMMPVDFLRKKRDAFVVLRKSLAESLVFGMNPRTKRMTTFTEPTSFQTLLATYDINAITVAQLMSPSMMDAKSVADFQRRKAHIAMMDVIDEILSSILARDAANTILTNNNDVTAFHKEFEIFKSAWKDYEDATVVVNSENEKTMKKTNDERSRLISKRDEVLDRIFNLWVKHDHYHYECNPSVVEPPPPPRRRPSFPSPPDSPLVPPPPIEDFKIPSPPGTPKRLTITYEVNGVPLPHNATRVLNGLKPPGDEKTLTPIEFVCIQHLEYDALTDIGEKSSAAVPSNRIVYGSAYCVSLGNLKNTVTRLTRQGTEQTNEMYCVYVDPKTNSIHRSVPLTMVKISLPVDYLTYLLRVLNGYAKVDPNINAKTKVMALATSFAGSLTLRIALSSLYADVKKEDARVPYVVVAHDFAPPTGTITNQERLNELIGKTFAEVMQNEIVAGATRKRKTTTGSGGKKSKNE